MKRFFFFKVGVYKVALGDLHLIYRSIKVFFFFIQRSFFFLILGKKKHLNKQNYQLYLFKNIIREILIRTICQMDLKVTALILYPAVTQMQPERKNPDEFALYNV